MIAPDPSWELVPGFAELGIVAFTTTRDSGSFAWHSEEETAKAVADRWDRLRAQLRPETERFVIAHQVHGKRVLEHHAGWTGLLRAGDADGHMAVEEATAMAVTLADCVPVFFGHPSGAAAVVHSGWRGTAAGIASLAIHQFSTRGYLPNDLTLHCGPAICGKCYEVSPDVYERLTGRAVDRPTPVDLRRLICDAAREAGVRNVSVSPRCTRCDNARFFSHRCGDPGRQLGVIVSKRRSIN
jgi:YfiH family protein